jgi:hypothetical protein
MISDRLGFALDYSKAKVRQRTRMKRSPAKASRLYFIQCGEFTKIGIASDPYSRLVELQVGCPYKLELLSVKYPADAGLAEELMHSRLDQYRVRGEWFKLPNDLLANLIAK